MLINAGLDWLEKLPIILGFSIFPTFSLCSLLSNLIVNGKNYGIHAFVVPLRSMVDHKTLPGKGKYYLILKAFLSEIWEKKLAKMVLTTDTLHFPTIESPERTWFVFFCVGTNNFPVE